MASFDLYSELKLDVLDRAEEETGVGASEFAALADRALDRAYHDILGRRPWLFTRATAPYILTLQGSQANTATVAVGSASAVLGAAVATNLVGFRFKPPLGVTVYRITAHAGGVNLTLEAPFQGPDALAAAPVTLFRDEYPLATSIRHIIGIWLMETTHEIEGPVIESEMRDRYPNPIVGTWPPQEYTRFSEFMIRLSQYPTKSGLAEVPYTAIPPDLSSTTTMAQIVIPRMWHWVLADAGLAHLLDIKEDSRATKWLQITEANIAKMAADEDLKVLGLQGTRRQTRREPAWR